MTIEENCNFKEIIMKPQNLNNSIINELLYNTYNNIVFSTIPYIIYKESLSKNCINKYNSGNCIGKCEFLKIYLKNNFNIDSYIIPASVPIKFKTEGTPHLTHCALLVPTSYHEFYIIDCALYFLQGMYCNLKNNIYRQIISSDIYSREIDKIDYILEDCKNLYLDSMYNQKLKEKSICVKCNYNDDPSDTWNYYLNEILNPDSNIGYSFLLNKPEPFILYTKIIDNKPVLLYKLIIDSDGIINVKSYPNKEIIFKGDSILFDNSEIKTKFNRYLSYEYI